MPSRQPKKYDPMNPPISFASRGERESGYTFTTKGGTDYVSGQVYSTWDRELGDHWSAESRDASDTGRTREDAVRALVASVDPVLVDS